MAINLVWFKRDIRLADNPPLQKAIADSIEKNKAIILLYVFEDILLHDPHYTLRHWRFVYQSLLEMANHLPNKALWLAHGNALEAIANIHQKFSIENIYSILP
jgi:deoxyribodipyrimidine photo-lyase